MGSFCYPNVSIHIKFSYDEILKEKDIQEKFIIKYKNYLMWPSLTFAVKLYLWKIWVFIMLSFMQSFDKIIFWTKKISNKKWDYVTLCDLQWPLRLYFKKLKVCVFIMCKEKNSIITIYAELICILETCIRHLKIVFSYNNNLIKFPTRTHNFNRFIIIEKVVLKAGLKKNSKKCTLESDLVW